MPGTFTLMLQLASLNHSAVELSGQVMREMFHIGVSTSALVILMVDLQFSGFEMVFLLLYFYAEPSLSTFYWLVQIYAVRGMSRA